MRSQPVEVAVLLFLGVTVGSAPFPAGSGRGGSQVVVFGATPAGIGAALSAAKYGNAVTLVDLQRHVGGMMSGGLGWDDVDCSYCPTASPAGVPSRAVYGTSVYRQFAARVRAHYAAVSERALELSVNGTRHEPHVAEQILLAMLTERNVSVRLGLRLTGVSVLGGRIRSLMVQPVNMADSSRLPPQTITGHAFIDASYEGDLLAQAGAPWTVGREGRTEYGELNAGVVFQDNVKKSFLRGSTGDASHAVPAMTWRLCFSTTANRKLMTAPPTNYNRSLYLGYLEDVSENRIKSVWNAWSGPRPLPPDGSKYDINCNPRPLGFIWAGGRKDE